MWSFYFLQTVRVRKWRVKGSEAAHVHVWFEEVPRCESGPGAGYEVARVRMKFAEVSRRKQWVW